MTTTTHAELGNIDSELRDYIILQLRPEKFSGTLKVRPPRRTRTTNFVKRPRDASTVCSSYRCPILSTVCSFFSEHFKGGELESVVPRLGGLEIRHAELTCADVTAEAKNRPTLYMLLSFSAFAVLSTLDLECNNLGDDGVVQLCAQCLPKLSHLKRLFIASNGIGLIGLEALVEYTEKSHPLQDIGLTNNSLYLNGDHGESDATPLLMRLFCTNRQLLRRLHLNHIGMPTHAVLKLMQLLSESEPFHKLEAVYLKQNFIDMELVQAASVEVHGKAIFSLFRF